MNSGWKKWGPLFSTQFLGVLNDNFLKNFIIFVSILWLSEEDQGYVIPIASAMLVLPFVLLSPLAGRLAQVYSKQKIYEYAKLAEIPIMVLAVIGFVMNSISLAMLALLLMGVQSALYAPSKYGLIRDVGGSEGLSFGVGTMELLTFMGVLSGQIIAGAVSDMPAGITTSISFLLISVAIFGYITSRKINVVEEAPTDVVKDSIEPISFTYKTARWARSVKGLNTTVLGLGGFWLIAALIQMNIYEHAPLVYELSNTGTAIIMGLIAVGIGLGCFLAGKFSKHRVELGMVPLGGLGLSIILTVFATTELSLIPFVICLFAAALFSGFYKVPLSAWIQERVSGRQLGKALAYNQLMAFLFILVAAGIFGYVVNAYDTYMVFVVLAVISWIMTIITIVNIPAMMLRFVAYILTHFYFKIEINGQEKVPLKSGALLVANHFSLMDPFLVVAAAPRMLRFVMDRKIYEYPLWKWLMKRLNMIPVGGRLDAAEREEFNKVCQKEVNNNHVLCIFPEGQISRIGHLLEFKKGIEHIASGVDVPIIPMMIKGDSGSLLSFDIGSSKPVFNWLKSFRRKITIEIGDPLPASSRAPELRQRMQFLNAQVFKRRIKQNHSLQYFAEKSAKNYNEDTFLYGKFNYSFRSLFEEATKRASFWTRTNKSHVGIDLSSDENLGLVHLSALLAGKVPVFLPVEMNSANKEAIVQEYDLDCILSEDLGDLYFSLEQFNSVNAKIKSTNQSTDLAAIFYEQTGSTWSGIPLTHENFIANIRGFMHVFKQPKEAKLYSDFALNSSYGIVSGFWVPYFFGISTYSRSAEERMKDTWEKAGINALFSEVEIVEELNNDQLAQLDYLITGTAGLEEEAAEKLKSADVFVSRSLGVPGGGLTVAMNTSDFEVTAISGGKPFAQIGSKKGSFGRPLPGLAAKVTDDGGKELTSGMTGTIWIYGAGISSAYQNDEGWLDSKTKGYIDEQGFLFLSENQD